MSFFNKSKKEPETKKEQASPADGKSQQANGSAASFVWVPNIYQQCKDLSNTDRVYGEKIPSLITEYKTLYNEKASKEDINKAFRNLMKEVIRTPYVVPFRYNETDDYPNDTVIHCTAQAANKFNIESIIYRCQDMTLEQMSNLYWVKDPATNILTIDLDWWDISRISGSKGFRFEVSNTPRTMYPRTATDGKHDYFLCFTGIDQYLKIFGEDQQMHIALYTINDIVDYITANESFSGIIINPDTETHCFIGKEAF